MALQPPDQAGGGPPPPSTPPPDNPGDPPPDSSGDGGGGGGAARRFRIQPKSATVKAIEFGQVAAGSVRQFSGPAYATPSGLLLAKSRASLSASASPEAIGSGASLRAQFEGTTAGSASVSQVRANAALLASSFHALSNAAAPSSADGAASGDDGPRRGYGDVNYTFGSNIPPPSAPARSPDTQPPSLPALTSPFPGDHLPNPPKAGGKSNERGRKVPVSVSVAHEHEFSGPWTPGPAPGLRQKLSVDLGAEVKGRKEGKIEVGIGARGINVSAKHGDFSATASHLYGAALGLLGGREAAKLAKAAKEHLGTPERHGVPSKHVTELVGGVSKSVPTKHGKLTVTATLSKGELKVSEKLSVEAKVKVHGRVVLVTTSVTATITIAADPSKRSRPSSPQPDPVKVPVEKILRSLARELADARVTIGFGVIAVGGAVGGRLLAGRGGGDYGGGRLPSPGFND